MRSDDLMKELARVLERYGFTLEQGAYAQQVEDDGLDLPDGTIEESTAEFAVLSDADLTIVLHCKRQQKHLH